MNSLVPGGWVYPKQTLAATNVSDIKAATDLAQKASRVGDGVTPPRVIYSPDAVYTDEARKKKRQGTVVLWTVIDDGGRVIQIRVEQCLGAGLDEAAVDAVTRWRFEPAKKNGQPVMVQMNIELDFPFTD